ncbi:MAG TPA: hypothetical protein VF037_03960, partial [Gemmatimonadales bacterium]
VTSSDGGTSIVIEDRGLAPMPVYVTVTYDGGQVEKLRVPVETWLAGARTAMLEAPPGRVIRIEIDASRIYPDADRSNNTWTPAVPRTG